LRTHQFVLMCVATQNLPTNAKSSYQRKTFVPTQPSALPTHAAFITDNPLLRTQSLRVDEILCVVTPTPAVSVTNANCVH
jgi:hypothetical protein